jgi:hypothetical protein
MKIEPDKSDFEAVERRYGRLPPSAPNRQAAEHYRLAQVTKLIRLYEQGKLPLELMREMDKLAR